MDYDIYIWKQNLYNQICKTLTDYESNEFHNINWEKEFYELLVDLTNHWDTLISEV